MLKKLLTLITLYLMTVPMLYAQTGSITGTVIDSKSGEGLPGANVAITEINRGASTDADGRYTITNVPSGTYTLRLSFIGYKSQSREVQVGAGKMVVNIQLKPSSLSLDEMVVTGYGEVEKTNIQVLSLRYQARI